MRREVNPVEKAGKWNNIYIFFFLCPFFNCIIASYWWLCSGEGDSDSAEWEQPSTAISSLISLNDSPLLLIYSFLIKQVLNSVKNFLAF